MRTPRIRASASNAISPWLKWSRPCTSARNVSCRSASHLTGRLKRFAANSTRTGFGIEERGARLGGGLEIDDRRQALVINLDQLGGVLGFCQGLGDDISDRVADIAYNPSRQDRPGRREHLRAALARHLGLGRDLG